MESRKKCYYPIKRYNVEMMISIKYFTEVKDGITLDPTITKRSDKFFVKILSIVTWSFFSLQVSYPSRLVKCLPSPSVL